MGMIIENSFTVPASAEKVTAYLLNPSSVARCLQGAQLTKQIDSSNFEGKMKMKMGPLDLMFAGKVTVTSADATTIRMKANGREEKGKGVATADVVVTITEAGGSTNIKLWQDINMQGQIASMGRGMMQDVAGSVITNFANCLKTSIR